MLPEQETSPRADVEHFIAGASVLDTVLVPATDATVILASGRRYDLESGSASDRLTVRSRNGEVVLHIEITDRGPVLSFKAAELELSASRKLNLDAKEIQLTCKGSMDLNVGGHLRERIGGHHQTSVHGDERLEARRVELQANGQGIAVRAAGPISMDGDHIGLNDDPMPEPFGWSGMRHR